MSSIKFNNGDICPLISQFLNQGFINNFFIYFKTSTTLTADATETGDKSDHGLLEFHLH